MSEEEQQAAQAFYKDMNQLRPYMEGYGKGPTATMTREEVIGSLQQKYSADPTSSYYIPPEDIMNEVYTNFPDLTPEEIKAAKGAVSPFQALETFVFEQQFPELY